MFDSYDFLMFSTVTRSHQGCRNFQGNEPCLVVKGLNGYGDGSMLSI